MGLTIALDGKPIHTPAKHTLTAPTQSLAEAIAGEWNAQGDTIDKNSMPITRLATIANDVIPVHREEVIQELLGYCDTDLILHRAPEPALQAQQERCFAPVMIWLKECGVHVRLAQGIMPAKQPPENREKVKTIIKKCINPPLSLRERAGVRELNPALASPSPNPLPKGEGVSDFHLAALSTLAHLTGSLYLSLYFLRQKYLLTNSTTPAPWRRPRRQGNGASPIRTKKRNASCARKSPRSRNFSFYYSDKPVKGTLCLAGNQMSGIRCRVSDIVCLFFRCGLSSGTVAPDT